jgi:signal transduction histidine kinase
MSMVGPAGSRVGPRRGERLDRALIAVTVALTVGAVGAAAVPDLRLRYVAPALDVVLETVTTLVTLSVAALAWARFRQRGEPVALFQAAAFLVLAIGNGLTVLLMATGLDGPAGMTLAAPTQAPLYDFAITHLFAAGLLVAGGTAALRLRRVDHARALVLGAAAALLLVIALVQLGVDRLPVLASVDATSVPSATPLGVVVEVVGAALFLWAAGISRSLYRRDGSIGDAYLTVGLVFAAFAQVEVAFHPGAYTGLVTIGDVMRLAFDVILLLGIQAEAAAAMSGLRRANDDLARLQVVELERAALQERARLARELHDGLAQDLWLAKLATGRLAALPDLGLAARALAEELSGTIDDGLAEARQAVAALRLSAGSPGTLCEMLASSVDDFADRFGLQVEFDCQGDLPPMSARAQAESLRITQEALTNVRRHADATVVRVRAALEEGRLVVVIGDNGRGFDPDAVGGSGFGVASMRERAALIGGELHIDSRPQDGTRVRLIVPFATVASAGAS